MDNQILIDKTAAEMKRRFSNENSGHDWWHMYRVWQTAKHIVKTEPTADSLVVELGALLHDIVDYKFANGDEEAGPQAAREWLTSVKVEKSVIKKIEAIIRSISFKGAKVAVDLPSIEAKIVFDADKLDAIGAIGVARTFAYGATKNRPMYDPAIKPEIHTSFEAYKINTSPTINHFYEKLLLLKDLFQTQEGQRMANHRHEFIEAYLKEFLAEWDGIK